MNSGNGTKVLARSQKGRMVAGVCAGVVGYFGIDVTLVRVIAAVVSVITGGAGVPACIELRGARLSGVRRSVQVCLRRP